MYNIFLHPKAKKSFDKLEIQIQNRIKEKISELKEFPNKGKHLQYSSFWSLRSEDYRIIYEINKKKEKIIVLFIGHRKHVYAYFSKLF